MITIIIIIGIRSQQGKIQQLKPKKQKWLKSIKNHFDPSNYFIQDIVRLMIDFQYHRDNDMKSKRLMDYSTNLHIICRQNIMKVSDWM